MESWNFGGPDWKLGLNMKGAASRIEPAEKGADFEPQGPIGILLVQLASYHMTLDSQLNLTSRQLKGMNIATVPWQDLPVRLNLMVRRERFYQMTSRKSDFNQNEMVDHAVLDTAMKAVVHDDKLSTLSALASGRWMSRHADKILGIQREDNMCPLCKLDKESLPHTIWGCCATQAQRVSSAMSTE